jgi:cytochrome c553
MVIIRALAVFACIAAPQLTAAQPAIVKAAAAGDMRSIYAGSQDIAEGKRIAQECTRCHNDNGVSTSIGVPSLAGQHAPYLHAQLRAYKNGERAHSPVTGAVRYMSDDALMKVAAYFASLEPPKAAPASRNAGPRDDPAAAGKGVAQQCAGCHGDNGVSSMPGTPNLVALDPKYFVAAISAYKGGQRKSDLMKPIAAGLSDIDATAVALHFALLKPEKSPNTAKGGDAAAGKAAATSCTGCHGDNGNSTSPDTPTLAGQDAEYLEAAINAYKDGSRSAEAMKGIAAALDAKTMKDLAAYFAAQAPARLAVRRPLGLAEWADRCDRCHGPNGNSIEPLIPRLAAQRADWLEAALVAYRKGERKSAAMSAMSTQLGDADIKEIALYYSRQPARSVIYVVVPN